MFLFKLSLLLPQVSVLLLLVLHLSKVSFGDTLQYSELFIFESSSFELLKELAEAVFLGLINGILLVYDRLVNLALGSL